MRIRPRNTLANIRYYTYLYRGFVKFRRSVYKPIPTLMFNLSFVAYSSNITQEQGIHDETPDDEWISNPWPVLTPARRPTSYERVFLGVNFFARFEMGPSAHKNACKEHLPCPIPVKLPSFNFSSSSLDVLPPSRSSFNDDPPPRSGDFVLPQSAASLDSTATSQVCFDPDLIDHLDFPAPLNAGDDVSSSLPRPLHRAPIFTRTSLPRETSWAMLNLRTRRPLSALTTEDHRRNSETLPRVQQRKKHHGRRPTVQSAEDVKEESGLLSRIKRALSRKLKL